MYSFCCCCYENYQCNWPLQEHLLPILSHLSCSETTEWSGICPRIPSPESALWKPTALFSWPPHCVIFVSWTIGENKALAIMSQMVTMFRVGCCVHAVSKSHSTPSPRGSYYVSILELKTEAQAGVSTHPKMLLAKRRARIRIQNWVKMPLLLCYCMVDAAVCGSAVWQQCCQAQRVCWGECRWRRKLGRTNMASQARQPLGCWKKLWENFLSSSN